MSSPTDERNSAGRRLVSIVIPVFNEESNVGPTYDALLEMWRPLTHRYDIEFVFTDNHSTDATFAKLKELAARDRRVKVIRFNRNYGFQRSLLTAYRYASGDAAVQVDCDLQDPPSVIPQFIELWENGHDVVVGLRQRRVEALFLSLLRQWFYRFIAHASGDVSPPGAGDFRLVDRSILDHLQAVTDMHPYVRGLISSLAMNEVGVPFDRRVRERGDSKFPLRRLVSFALAGIVSHSVLPLRFATYVGLAISIASACLAGFYLFGALLFGQNWPSGFATTTLLLLFGISLNAIFLGIVGEYIGRIYLQVRNPQLVVVEQALNVKPQAARQPSRSS